MRAGTLFSGIGAPECAMPSIDWRWCADIDPFACAVHRARFPGVPNLGDVTRLSADAIEPVDLIVFGSPCQSFSVAGKRLGLDDPRGNLTLVGISLISKLKPRYVVWENVPGVLSDDDGKTIQTVIDLFTQIGYVCDIDVWDAQHFGVPQRRRRVFVTCVLLDDLTKQRTSISERIMGDLLAQALLATWGAALAAWSPEPGHSAFASRTELPAGSLQKKMRSFDALLGGSAVTRLLGFWDGSLAPCTEEPPNSGSTSLLRRERPKPASRTGIAGFPSPEPMGSGDGDRNIGLSLRAIWEDFWHRVSGPTTSTSTDSITSREICSFARLSLSIVQSIISSPDCSLSRPWSSDFWSLAFSSLRLAEDVIDYARSASCELFSPPKLRADWGDNLDAARSCYDLIERRIGGWATPGQIFSFAKSLRGDTAPRREAGERVAASLTHGVDSGGKGGYAGRRREDDTNLVAFGIDSDCFDRSGEGVDGTPGQRSGLGIQEECSSALRSKRPNAGTIGGNRQSGPLEVATAVNAHGGPHGRLDFESETFVSCAVHAVNMAWSTCEMSHKRCEGAQMSCAAEVRTEMQQHVRAIAALAPEDSRKAALSFAANVLRMPFDRVRRLFYGQARRVEAHEADQIRAYVEAAHKLIEARAKYEADRAAFLATAGPIARRWFRLRWRDRRFRKWRREAGRPKRCC
jgi:site-specific DNA-cytosine methylase